MRIGLTGGASTVDRMVDQAARAEAEGFSTMWYPGAVGGDPLVAMPIVARGTTSIELGTSVVQTYTAHPVLMATRALAAAVAMNRPGFALGIGPSHRPAIEDVYGLSYARVGRHTEEYVRVLAPLLRGEAVDFEGDEFRVHAPAGTAPTHPITLLLAALAPRMLRVAGELTDGTVLWMANARAIETHVAPRIHQAASAAGRPEPRIVAGLPVAVVDDEAEGRRQAGAMFAGYGELPNYRRILDIGQADGPADAAIVGDERSVERQIAALFDAGATELWAAPFPVGADGRASRDRTRELLRTLVG